MLKILVITTVKIGYDGLTDHIFSYFGNMDKTDILVDLVSARGIDSKIMPVLDSIGFNHIYRLEYRDNKQLKYLKELIKLIKTNKYDIIHAHGNSATLATEMAAGIFGGTKIRIAHSHNTSCKHKIFDACLRPIFNICYTQGFACGNDAGKWLFKNKKFTVIPNGKDINKYKFNGSVREIYRKKLNLENDIIAIGNVAAFVEKKNHKFIINVFIELYKKNHKYEMFLFGIDGESLDSVKNQIKQLKLEDKIHYMGTKGNIQDYIQAMDIMLLPSLYEGFPISVIEWTINGLPCILSDTITRDINILGNIKYLPIDKGVKLWVNELLNVQIDIGQRDITNIEKIFTKAGFNIKSNAAKLKSIYFNLYKKRKN